MAAGEAQRFFRNSVLTNHGDDCLIWPYQRNRDGYGRVRWQGRMQIVSRLVCELKNGPPPTVRHEAAHSCGRGGDGCVAPAHVAWSDHAGNMADSAERGVHRGSRNGRAKLDEDAVRAIRDAARTMSPEVIAARYGIAGRTVRNILAGERWGWLP